MSETTQCKTSDIPNMHEIPIIISAPDCHPLPEEGNQRQHDGEGQRLVVSGPSGSEPPPPPGSHHGQPLNTSVLVSEGTQTDLPDEKPIICDSPTYSHNDSPPARTPFGVWADHFHHHHLLGPHSCRQAIAAESLLAPPGADLPHRPMTPRADLYNGQTSANFGMTFGGRPAPHWRSCSKPATCPNTYEDQKHRMMMNWLERRGTV
ncbi:hypothetical protein PV04_06553 [Phialophora macrospora]|uniref:Uncharacterized protein n=1 Tax=Phialophora macrospora TaxID=1851006 RepID=A0A0D2FGU2_9EURO|nr:hypothetical protein PV04_06553 [Phialophora macrospora]